MDTEIPKLSPAQAKMLQKAALRYGRVSRAGNEQHYTHIYRGQSSTAKALKEMGLGGYTMDDGVRGAKFWIWDTGFEVAVALGLVDKANIMARNFLRLQSSRRREILDRLALIYFGEEHTDPEHQRKVINKHSLADLLFEELSLY